MGNTPFNMGRTQPQEGVAFKVYASISAKTKSPGPGRYTIPSAFGSKDHDYTRNKNPSYSMGGKGPGCLVERKSRSPGPCHFVQPDILCSGKAASPSSTLSPRIEPLKTFLTPSPSKYLLKPSEKATFKSAPSFVIGEKIEPLKPSKTPAGYDSLPMIGRIPVSHKNSAPAYSMRALSTQGGFAVDLAKSPSPNSYTLSLPVVKKSSPSYSLGLLTYPPLPVTKTPGPGSNEADKVTVTSRKCPAYTLGVQHSPYKLPVLI